MIKLINLRNSSVEEFRTIVRGIELDWEHSDSLRLEFDRIYSETLIDHRIGELVGMIIDRRPLNLSLLHFVQVHVSSQWKLLNSDHVVWVGLQ